MELNEFDKKKSNFKKSLEELILSSSFHGFVKIVKTKHIFLKIIWVFFVLVSLLSCSYLIIKNILYYLDYNVVTNINVIYEIPTTFPTVSLCQQNIDYSSNASYLSSKVFIKCKFNLQNCNESDFSVFYDPYYGNCYKFNGGYNSKGQTIDLLNSKEAGKFYAFQMELFFDDPYFTGFHVYIHNDSINPSPVEGLDVSNGFETNIIVNRIFDSKLGYPYSDCITDLTNSASYFEHSLFNEYIKTHKMYRQKDCIDLVLFQELLTICNCSLIKNVDSLLCVSDPLLKQCYWDFYSRIYDNFSFDKIQKICPLECESVIYTISVVVLDYPSRKYYEDELSKNHLIQSKSNLSIEQFKKHLLSINVYYEDLKYTSISQQPKLMPVDLLANIGGIFGFFLGISFLSFVEIIEIILEGLFFLIGKRIN